MLPLNRKRLGKISPRLPHVLCPITAVCPKADWYRFIVGDAVDLDGVRFGDVWRPSAIQRCVDDRASAGRLDAEPAARNSATDISMSRLELLEGSTARSRAAAVDGTRRGSILLAREQRSINRCCWRCESFFRGRVPPAGAPIHSAGPTTSRNLSCRSRASRQRYWNVPAVKLAGELQFCSVHSCRESVKSNARL